MKATAIPFKNNLYVVTFFVILACACKEPSPKNNPDPGKKQSPKKGIIKKPGSSFTDTIFVDKKAAVFFAPDSLQMEKIKNVNEKATYDMLIHDCHYQMENAKLSLKQYWPQIKIIDALKARYLIFIKEDQSRTIIDLNDKNDICGLLLFDRKKAPILADMPNIETVLNLYFQTHKN
ncbi:MAG: hypothetical protein JST58_11600 [Bacteroidetes bacterium]|jgi:hypothetical protein|nr:hypothetical protein [Bacteroidota bacterium]